MTASNDTLGGQGGELSWCEIDTDALEHNARAFKGRVGDKRLGIVVKADAYGHGLVLAARAFVRGGADWLIVNAVQEAVALRQAGLELPLYVVGNVARSRLAITARGSTWRMRWSSRVMSAIACREWRSRGSRPTMPISRTRPITVLRWLRCNVSRRR
jgi:hypothetical protein